MVAALDAFDAAVERRIDLAEVNGRVFVNNVSLGVYAKIVQSPEYRDAKRSTTLAMLADLVGPGAEPFDLHFVGPDGAQQDGARIIQISNNPYLLTSLKGFGSRARLDTGELGVAAADIRGARDITAFFAAQWLGRLDRFGGWIRWNTDTPHHRVGRTRRGRGRRRGAAARPPARVPQPAGRAPGPHRHLGPRLLPRRPPGAVAVVDRRRAAACRGGAHDPDRRDAALRRRSPRRYHPPDPAPRARSTTCHRC